MSKPESHPRMTAIRRDGDATGVVARVGPTKFGVALSVAYGDQMGTGVTLTPGHARLVAAGLLRAAGEFEAAEAKGGRS